MRVVRGPGWRWQVQNGGPGCQGKVINCAIAMAAHCYFNASVVWDNGGEQYWYCWGNYQGRYNLQVHI